MQIDDEGMHRWTLVLSIAAIGGCVVLALLRLTAMLGRAGAGDSFGVAADLRGFASWLFLAVLAMVLLPGLIQLAIRMITGERLLVTVTISVPEAMMLLMTGLLFFVARLLDEAERIAEEARQIL